MKLKLFFIAALSLLLPFIGVIPAFAYTLTTTSSGNTVTANYAWDSADLAAAQAENPSCDLTGGYWYPMFLGYWNGSPGWESFSSGDFQYNGAGNSGDGGIPLTKQSISYNQVIDNATGDLPRTVDYGGGLHPSTYAGQFIYFNFSSNDETCSMQYPRITHVNDNTACSYEDFGGTPPNCPQNASTPMPLDWLTPAIHSPQFFPMFGYIVPPIGFSLDPITAASISAATGSIVTTASGSVLSGFLNALPFILLVVGLFVAYKLIRKLMARQKGIDNGWVDEGGNIADPDIFEQMQGDKVGQADIWQSDFDENGKIDPKAYALHWENNLADVEVVDVERPAEPSDWMESAGGVEQHMADQGIDDTYYGK